MTPEGTYTSFDVFCDMGPDNESWLVRLYYTTASLNLIRTHLVLMLFSSRESMKCSKGVIGIIQCPSWSELKAI